MPTAKRKSPSGEEETWQKAPFEEEKPSEPKVVKVRYTGTAAFRVYGVGDAEWFREWREVPVRVAEMLKARFPEIEVKEG